MRILAISGSLRDGSHNTALLRLAEERLPEGDELVLWQGIGDVPIFDEDAEEPVPPVVAALRRAVAEADAVLVATPEYNSSLPGGLKNVLDWASRPFATNPFRSKPVAVVGASTSMFGAAWAQEDAKKVLKAMGARVVDAGLAVPKAADALARPSEELLAGLDEVLWALAAEAEPLASAA